MLACSAVTLKNPSSCATSPSTVSRPAHGVVVGVTQPLPTLSSTAFSIGKKTNLFAGIVTLRVTGPGGVPNQPARKNTGPTSPNFALSPVRSISGLSVAGIAYAHFHQMADHSPRVLPATIECGGRTTGRSSSLAGAAGNANDATRIDAMAFFTCISPLDG